jgi:hypothetical protein
MNQFVACFSRAHVTGAVQILHCGSMREQVRLVCVQWYQNEREQQQVAALFNDKLSVRDKRRRVHYIGNAAVAPTFDPTPRKKTIDGAF